ncbi:unnamed protein product [Ectocarpus sp. CCAP 1310/34]|nr:unnamed protein product [Ectocarpus sp. CCAP 1310/34]
MVRQRFKDEAKHKREVQTCPLQANKLFKPQEGIDLLDAATPQKERESWRCCRSSGTRAEVHRRLPKGIEGRVKHAAEAT